MKKFCTILLFLMSSYVTQAKSENEIDKVENFKKSENIELAEKLRIVRLEEQNKILLNNANELRNSYYWALGFSATFLLIFLGLNIYSSNRRFDDEKINLEKIVNNKVEEEILKLNKENEKNKNIVLNELKVRLEERKGEVDNKLLELSNLIKEDNSSLSCKIKEMNFINKINNISLEIQIRALEFDALIKDGVKATIINKAVTLCNLCSELNKLQGTDYQDWRILKYLAAIDENIDQYVKDNHFIVQEVEGYLFKLDSKYETHKSRILEKLR